MSNLRLYSPDEKAFQSFGVGTLGDVVDDHVYQELNGQYELELKYPLCGSLAEHIIEDAYIMASPEPGKPPQPFRIYRIQKKTAALMCIYARHLVYNLRHICVPPFAVDSVAAAMIKLRTTAITSNPFHFWTDKRTPGHMASTVPSDIWSLLGGREGSVLDRYHGEYEFDRYDVKLYNRRGADRGVSIRYGKNLRDLEQDRNISNTITGIYPYWTNEEGKLVELPEKYISGPGQYREPKIIPVDLSGRFEAEPTEELLRAAAEDYIADREIGVPRVSIKVEYIPLEKTEEYKSLPLLERVSLGDTVHVEFPEMQVSASARVVKTDFRPSLDRYDSVTIGRVRSNLASTIVSQKKEAEDLIQAQKTDMQAAIEAATAWLTNGKGYKVERRNGAGQIVDTLYLDTPDINTAVNILRVGQSGIGFSHGGVNGPYVDAFTIDGKFNASFILTGVLTANLIKTGAIADKNGNFLIDLDKGSIIIKAGEIRLGAKLQGQYAFVVEDTGRLKATIGEIAGFTMVGKSLVTDDYRLTPQAISFTTDKKDVGSLLIQRGVADKQPAGLSMTLGRDGKVLAWNSESGPIMHYHKDAEGPGSRPNTLDIEVGVNGHDKLFEHMTFDEQTAHPLHGYSGKIRVDGVEINVVNGYITTVF